MPFQFNIKTGTWRLSRYIPANAIAEAFPTLNAVVYRFEGKNQTGAIAYSGRRSNPDFHHLYSTTANREVFIQKWLTHLEQQLASKIAHTAAKKAFKHTLKVGDILVSSWGYEQTNLDFYKVIHLKGAHSVELQVIGQTLVEANSSMSGYYVPDINAKGGTTYIKRVLMGNCIKICDVIRANPWDGRPKYCSWYA